MTDKEKQKAKKIRQDRYKKFEKIAFSKGLSIYQVAKATGIESPTFSNWKKGLYMPKYEKMLKICEYLQVKIEDI